MEKILAQKVCLITGASRGLGREIGLNLGRRGATIAVHFHQSKAAAQDLCQEIEDLGGKASAFQADATQTQALDHMLEEITERLGAINILVNNVGPYVDTPFLELSLTDYDHVMAGNLRATFLLSQQLGLLMKERGAGQIINIAATDAFHRSHSVYGLAKAALIHLTEAIALELAPEVCVNAIAPDLIADNEDMSAEFAREAVAATPSGRLVSRAEVAEMTYLFCTPAFRNVTGQTLVMDGGRSIPRINSG